MYGVMIVLSQAYLTRLDTLEKRVREMTLVVQPLRGEYPDRATCWEAVA